MTRVLLATSVSSRIASYASLTIPRTAAYCLQHGYSHLVVNEPYDAAVGRAGWLTRFFGDGGFDLIWTLDADCVITDPSKPIHSLDCLGPDVTVCEEGIVEWNRINCGAVVWRDTPKTRLLMEAISTRQSEWRPLACGWQTWLHGQEWRQVVTVAPRRSFNSTAWSNPGGAAGEPGSHWRPGDFVYHPCGIFPLEARVAAIKEVLDATA